MASDDEDKETHCGHCKQPLTDKIIWHVGPGSPRDCVECSAKHRATCRHTDPAICGNCALLLKARIFELVTRFLAGGD